MYVFDQVLLLWKLWGLDWSQCFWTAKEGALTTNAGYICGEVQQDLAAPERKEQWWLDQGWILLQSPLCSDTESNDKDWQVRRQPLPSCQCIAFLQWRRGSLEKRAAGELNQLVSFLLRAVLSCSPACCYCSSASFSSIRPNRNTSWKRLFVLFESRLWFTLTCRQLHDRCSRSTVEHQLHMLLDVTGVPCCALRLGLKKSSYLCASVRKQVVSVLWV